MLQLVNESVTSVIDQETADTSQCFGCKEFDLERCQRRQLEWYLIEVAFSSPLRRGLSGRPDR